MLEEHKNDLELAVKIADRIISIQECTEGYDYYIMDSNYLEIDGGIYDNQDISIVEALKEIIEDLAENPDYNGAKGAITKDSEITILDYDDVMEEYDRMNSLGPALYDSEIVMNFKAKTEECFHQIDAMGASDIEDMVLDYVKDKLYGMDVEVMDAVISGSRCRGLEGDTSDLDVVVEIKGSEREDYLFNILNDGELFLGNIPIDINPITKQETGTLEEYLPRVEKYLEEKAQKKVEKKPSLREKLAAKKNSIEKHPKYREKVKSKGQEL